MYEYGGYSKFTMDLIKHLSKEQIIEIIVKSRMEFDLKQQQEYLVRGRGEKLKQQIERTEKDLMRRQKRRKHDLVSSYFIFFYNIHFL
jgi:hypothetical protein